MIEGKVIFTFEGGEERTLPPLALVAGLTNKGHRPVSVRFRVNLDLAKKEDMKEFYLWATKCYGALEQ